MRKTCGNCVYPLFLIINDAHCYCNFIHIKERALNKIFLLLNPVLQ